jgi:hypothetical protein
MDDGVSAMNAVHNARITLLATIVNNLAAAFAVAGFVAPAASGQMDTAGDLSWRSFGSPSPPDYTCLRSPFLED